LFSPKILTAHMQMYFLTCSMFSPLHQGISGTTVFVYLSDMPTDS